jgi:hypothetical protein
VVELSLYVEDFQDEDGRLKQTLLYHDNRPVKNYTVFFQEVLPTSNEVGPNSEKGTSE